MAIALGFKLGEASGKAWSELTLEEKQLAAKQLNSQQLKALKSGAQKATLGTA